MRCANIAIATTTNTQHMLRYVLAKLAVFIVGSMGML